MMRKHEIFRDCQRSTNINEKVMGSVVCSVDVEERSRITLAYWVCESLSFGNTKPPRFSEP